MEQDKWERTGQTRTVPAYHGGGTIELPWMRHTVCGRRMLAPRVFKHRCPGPRSQA